MMVMISIACIFNVIFSNTNSTEAMPNTYGSGIGDTVGVSNNKSIRQLSFHCHSTLL